ncbi:MAG TPA: transposase [Candidatus Atribacteria bacterium]|nr:transposase [Candidatus Atribacteria bacterium]
MNPAQAQKTLEEWCKLAMESQLERIMTFAQTLKKYIVISLIVTLQ